MPPIIVLENITYSYPGAEQPALYDFSLSVEEGEFLLVTGVSGAGKSTLLRLLNGLVPHFYGGTLVGRVRVAGLDPVALGPGQMSSTVGLVFQDPEAQFVAEVVEDELAFAMENAGTPLPLMRKRVEESLHALGIEHLRGRRVSTLSGGERQRVAIAAVLTMQPKVLVLDEPTSQLDPQSAEEVLDSLVKLNRDLGLTIVLSEHRLERVVQHADRILYIGAGGEALVGEPRDVLAQIPLAPPLAQVGKLLGLKPLPLTIKEARRQVVGMTGPATERPSTQSPDTEPSISLQSVWFGYPGQEVLRGLSLDLYLGEITALMGRNGAGKTTILRLIMGLLRPARGRVTTLGLDAATAGSDAMSKLLGYVPQQPDVLLFADTVQGEVDFTRKAHNLSRHKDDLLDRLGLAKYSAADPKDLSVGERQRVALAAILAGAPKALVLDEPTRGLDYIQKDKLAAILQGLKAEGCTVLLATHDVELAAHMADRVVLLGDGEIVADGPAREVMSGSLVFSSQVNKLFRDPAFVTVDDVLRAVQSGAFTRDNLTNLEYRQV